MMNRQPVVHPSAWRASDFESKSAITVTLTAGDLDELDLALQTVRDKEPETVERDDFALGSMNQRLHQLREEVLYGRGIVVLRGLPVDRYDVRDMQHIVWGLGLYLGAAVSQSQHGDRIGHVVDVSREHPGERGYRSRMELGLHTDSDNIVMMACLCQAKSGGVNRFASASAIYNEILRTKPHLLETLFNGFRYHWRGEQARGEPPITDYRVPVLSQVDGELSCVFLREFIEMAADDLGEPLSALELEAIGYFQSIAFREDMCLHVRLDPGEAFLINNLTVLHSRTEFEDYEEPDRRRHLLRLWLKVDGARPLADGVRRYYGVDGIQPSSNPSTVYVHAKA